jgi:hypothetical protein
LIGNSVYPDEAEALVGANAADIIDVLPAPRSLTHLFQDFAELR